LNFLKNDLNFAHRSYEMIPFYTSGYWLTPSRGTARRSVSFENFVIILGYMQRPVTISYEIVVVTIFDSDVS